MGTVAGGLLMAGLSLLAASWPGGVAHTLTAAGGQEAVYLCVGAAVAGLVGGAVAAALLDYNRSEGSR
jgi:hypothetical protein